MTAYTVAVGDTGKYEKTLAAATEDTVTFGGSTGDATITDLNHVEIIHHSGGSPIYYRFGATVTAAADTCHGVVTPGGRVLAEVPTAGDTDLHLISAGAAVYSVLNGG